MNIEADSGGGLQYGGEFRRRISISRRIPGADCNRGEFILDGGGFFSLVKAKPVILCRRSSTRGGGLHKSIQLRGSYLCHVSFNHPNGKSQV